MTDLGFGGRLKTLLEERDMTQAELSRLLHLGKSTISSYVAGTRTPDLSTLRRIAEAFAVSVDYLLGLSEVRWPATLKEPDLELVLRRTGELTSEERQRLLDYLDYLRYERRRKTPDPGPEGRSR